MSPDARRVVRVYMGDHLTVMRAGSRLAGRMLGSGGHRASEGTVRSVAEGFEAMGLTLAALLRQLGASPPRSKLLAGTVAELLGRTKLNGRLRGRSPLAEVLELEALGATLGLTAAGWRGLDGAGIAADAVVVPEAERCEGLRAAVEADARAAAARVLAVGTGPTPR